MYDQEINRAIYVLTGISITLSIGWAISLWFV